MFGNFFHKQAKASLYPSYAKGLENEVQQIFDTQTLYLFPNLQRKYSSYDFLTKFVWQECELLHTNIQGNRYFCIGTKLRVNGGIRGRFSEKGPRLSSCEIYYGRLITWINNRKFIAAKI
jgi:hypothetical protein